MSQRNPIDDMFRQKLEGYQVDPPMHVWDKIAAERKPRRGFVFWWQRNWAAAAGVILLAGIAGALTFYAGRGDDLIVDSLPIPGEGDARYEIRDAGLGNETVTDQVSISEVQQTKIPAISKVGKNESITNNKRIVAAVQKVNEVIAAHQEENKSELTENPVATSREVIEVSPISTLSYSEAGMPVVHYNKASIRPNSQGRGGISTVDLLPLEYRFFEIPEQYRASYFKKVIKGKKEWNPDKARKKKHNWGLNMIASTGIAAHSRQFNSHNVDANPYLNVRNETEKSRLGTQTSFRLALKTPLKFQLSSGIEYTRISEKFSFSSRVDDDGVTTAILGTNGEHIDTDPETIDAVRDKKSNNVYEFVDLPILAGYEKRFGRIGLSLFAGPQINLIFNKSGNVVSPYNSLPVSIDEDNEASIPMFKERVSVSWAAQAGISYHLSGRTHLMLIPKVRFSPNLVDNASYDYEQKFNSFGLQFGLKTTIF